MKIVVDTNVFVSALFSRNGASHLLLRGLFEEEDKVNCVSNTLVAELQDVLLRSDNRERCPQFSESDLIAFIDDVCLVSWHVEINFLWRPFLKDPDDDMVLEAAFNGGAEMIVTHNVKDYRNVEAMFGIRVATPKEYLVAKGVLR